MTASDVQNGPGDIAGQSEAQIMELCRHPQKGWLSALVVSPDDLFLAHVSLVSLTLHHHEDSGKAARPSFPGGP
jgi:hypothetical protein